MLVVPRRTSDFELDPTPVAGTSVGRAHYDDDGQLVARQAEFRFKNYVSLRDLQRLLLSIVDPSLPGATDTGLSTSERRFLFDALEQDPRDSQNPRYQGERYAISHYKPIWRGVSRELRVISKGGRAYGFEVDNAYLAHRQSGRSMFIAIVAYANPNEIVNDDGYAYHLTASLFEAIAGELSRWLTAP
jgi:hypothetical protein